MSCCKDVQPELRGLGKDHIILFVTVSLFSLHRSQMRLVNLTFFGVPQRCDVAGLLPAQSCFSAGSVVHKTLWLDVHMQVELDWHSVQVQNMDKAVSRGQSH